MKKTTKNLLSALLILLGLSLLGTAGWLWYDNNVDRSGWVLEDGLYSYTDFHGKKITGWLTLEDRTYHFDDDCHLSTGWQQLENGTCYFGTDGVLRLGFVSIEGKTYYFDPKTGAMCTGWKTVEGKTYYFGGLGPMVTGWQEIEGNTYYLGSDGALATQWLTLETGTYYLGDDGIPRTGKQQMEDGLRLFRPDGTMVTGWEDEEDGRHYYDDQGLMVSGWTEVEGKRYFLSEEGILQTGWHEEGEYRYYLQEDGSAAVGRLELEGDVYYFTPKGIHVILVNKNNPIPKYYKTDVVVVEDYHRIQRIALEPLRQMLADCRGTGIKCIFNSSYRSTKEQTDILETRTEEYADTGMSYEEAYKKALETVALPGTSEHQLGLSCDLVGKEANEWLAQHCWEYGFILRYPEGKWEYTGIINEPWHFRYVGKEVSMDMKDSGLCLEEYLGAGPVY